MGIDKPDVRFVVHIDLPDNLEAYFQEAGRAGRDEQNAYSVVLWSDEDIALLHDHWKSSFPDEEQIKRVYIALGNYCQLATGAGEETQFDFEPMEFFKNFSIVPVIGFNALKVLELEGFISMTEALHTPSQFKFLTNNEDLYRYQVTHPMMDNFIRLLLRTYSGMFDELSKINEQDISKKSGLSVEMVVKNLNILQDMQLGVYIPKSGNPKIIWQKNRIHERDFVLTNIFYERKVLAEKKYLSVSAYIKNHEECRNTQLLYYFGEKSEFRCGKCDVCLELNKFELSNLEFETIQNDLMKILQDDAFTFEEIAKKLSNHREDKIKKVMRWLSENNHLIEEDGKFKIL